MNDHLVIVPSSFEAFTFSHHLVNLRGTITPCFAFRGKLTLVAPVGSNGCGIVRILCEVVGEQRRLRAAVDDLCRKGSRSVIVSEDVTVEEGKMSRVDLSRTLHAYALESETLKGGYREHLGFLDARIIALRLDFFVPEVSRVRTTGEGLRTEGWGWKAPEAECRPSTLMESGIPNALLEEGSPCCPALEGLTTRELLSEAGYSGGQVRRKRRRNLHL